MRYPLRRLLGQGGMGEVKLCRDLTIGREVAMKRMLPAHARDANARARFVREAQVQGQLEHPAIVPVYDLAADPDGGVFFTMKRLRGRTLADILDGLQRDRPEDRDAFPLHRLLQTFSSICLAIEFAHSRGVLHRDLKPANIMIGDFGEVYVLDWGLAKIQGDSDGAIPAPEASSPAAQLGGPISSEAEDPTATWGAANPAAGGPVHSAESVKTAQGQIVGTLAYMSPEQTYTNSDRLDARSDVFTLGVILFEILTLERLRPRKEPAAMFIAIRAERGARPADRAPHRDVPPELDEICFRATQRDPATRYQTARALQKEVERYLSGERDTALRREMSAQHSQLAVNAARYVRGDGPESDEARRNALSEVGRALALDPNNRSALELLGQILSEPPTQVPPEVEAQIKADLAARERLRLQSLVLSGVAAVVLIPLLLLMGVRSWPLMGMLGLCSVSSLALRWWVTCPTTPMFWRYASQVVSLAMMFCFGRILGPLVLMTMPLTVHTVLHSISGQAALRRFVLFTSCTLICGMVALEQLGWMTPSYHFADGNLIITPNLINLPPTLTMVLLLGISILYLLLPGVAICRLPVHLAEAERRLALHTWQLRQLLPEANSLTSGPHSVALPPPGVGRA